MSDDPDMRFRLQQVAAYRELCRYVRKSGRGNVFFACLMLFLAYASWQAGLRGWVAVFYGVLALAELGVGFLKWVFPSAEGVLLDGLILLMFAAVNLGSTLLRLQRGGNPDAVALIIGVMMLSGAASRFRNYGSLRRLFARRPTADQMAWVDDLAHEIRTADPEADDLALDLPTKPHMRAKLLGGTAFFVERRGTAFLVAGPDEFALVPEGADRRTGRQRVVLYIHDQVFPDFPIDDASWDNYRKWLAANTPTHP